MSPVCTVSELKSCLTHIVNSKDKSSIVHGFPIVDDDNKLIGLITREVLMVLLKKECWMEKDLRTQLTLAEIQGKQQLKAYRSMVGLVDKIDKEEEEKEVDGQP